MAVLTVPKLLQGSDVVYSFTVPVEDDFGIPSDLVFTLQSLPQPDVVILRKTIDDGVTLISSVKFSVTFDTIDTIDLAPDVYSWMALITTTGKNKPTILEAGQIEIVAAHDFVTLPA